MSVALSDAATYEDPRESNFKTMMEARLKASRFTAAARVVLEATRIGLAPNDLSLLHWIVAHIGTHAAQEVISKGFAQLNSPCCTSGFEPCDLCDGVGRIGDHACIQCATMGKLRCPFCNGSSLIPLSDLPLALRPRTMIARIRLVDGHARAMLKAEACEPSSPPESLTYLRTEFLNLDKLLGVLENAVLEMRQLAAATAWQELGEQVQALARKLRDRQLKTLRKLSAVELERGKTGDQRAAAHSSASVLQEIWQLGSLARTRLAHPFLFTEDVAPD
jgi:hypothetical protein